mgnify:CR=1 FL=1
MAKIFTALSENQRLAVGTPCKECATGIYKERSGKFGPFVSCSRYPACDSKVMRPRGFHVSSDTVPNEVEALASVIPEVVAPIAPATSTFSENFSMAVPASSLESQILALVQPSINSALAKVEIDAGKVLSVVQAEIAKLSNAAPLVIEVKREDQPTRTIEGAHYLMPRLLKLLSAGFHVYLWGPAGSGKSTALMQALTALGKGFEIDTLDQTTMRSMVQGFCRPNGEANHTSFTRCWQGDDTAPDGRGYIAEECDNAPANIQNLFNSALANGHAPLAWGNVERKPGFSFCGNGNTAFRPTRSFPDRKPGSAAFIDRLYFMHWPIDPAIEARVAGVASCRDNVRVETTCTPAAWHAFVTGLRAWAMTNAPTLMITPRATLLGLQALACGETPAEIAHALIFRGADNELVSKALNAVALPREA